MGEQRENNLRDYRRRSGMTQAKAVEAIKRRAKERGDPVEPGLDTTSVCHHEKGHKWPSLHYQTLYCEVYGATLVELGLAESYPENVNRREFLASTASLLVTTALPPMQLGQSDIERLRASVTQLYRMDDLHGGGSAVHATTVQTFQRLHSLVEHASYDQATGRALKELTGLAAEHAAWQSFDANRDDDARRWWNEAMRWAQLAESDAVSVVAIASMSLQASKQDRPREVIDLCQVAQRAGASSPRLGASLISREATGHAGLGDASRALGALRRARGHTETRNDDDPIWLDYYGPAVFASHECRVALMLGDLPAAEEAARTALALDDPIAYPRYYALSLIELAEVLIRRRELDEAAVLAQQATVAAAGLNSARVTQALHAVTQRLAA